MSFNDILYDMHIWLSMGFASQVQLVAIGTHEARSRLEIDAAVVCIVVGGDFVCKMLAQQHEVAAS